MSRTFPHTIEHKCEIYVLLHEKHRVKDGDVVFISDKQYDYDKSMRLDFIQAAYTKAIVDNIPLYLSIKNLKDIRRFHNLLEPMPQDTLNDIVSQIVTYLKVTYPHTD